jgi:hypothetical protein
VTLCVSDHSSPSLEAKGWGETPLTSPSSHNTVRSLIPTAMPSQQERRKAERDAAKRASAQTGAAGAVGAAGAAAALADLRVDPDGDWTTQTEDPFVGPGVISWRILPCSPDLASYDVIMHNSRDEGSKCGEGRGQLYLHGPTPRC